MPLALRIVAWLLLKSCINCEWQAAEMGNTKEEFDDDCDSMESFRELSTDEEEARADDGDEDVRADQMPEAQDSTATFHSDNKKASVSKELATVLSREDFGDLFQHPSGVFWSKYWEREPVLWRTDGFFRKAAEQLSWKAIEQSNIVFTQAGNELKTPSYKRYAGAFYNKSKYGQAGATMTGSDLLASLQDGETIVFGSIHKWNPEVMKLIKWLGSLCGRRTNANAYVIKHGADIGLDVHNDQHDFIVAQLEGSKRWKVWVAPDKFLPLGVVSQSHGTQKKMSEKDVEQLGHPCLDVILFPGDLLYVPRGAVHLTSTLEGHQHSLTNYSFHITVAIAMDGFALPWVVGAGEYVQIPQHDYIFPAYLEAAHQLSRKDVKFRRSIRMKEDTHLVPESIEDIRKALHAIVDEVIDHTGFIAAIEDRLSYVRHVGRQQSWETLPQHIRRSIPS